MSGEHAAKAHILFCSVCQSSDTLCDIGVSMMTKVEKQQAAIAETKKREAAIEATARVKELQAAIAEIREKRKAADETEENNEEESEEESEEKRQKWTEEWESFLDKLRPLEKELLALVPKTARIVELETAINHNYELYRARFAVCSKLEQFGLSLFDEKISQIEAEYRVLNDERHGLKDQLAQEQISATADPNSVVVRVPNFWSVYTKSEVERKTTQIELLKSCLPLTQHLSIHDFVKFSQILFDLEFEKWKLAESWKSPPTRPELDIFQMTALVQMNKCYLTVHLVCTGKTEDEAKKKLDRVDVHALLYCLGIQTEHPVGPVSLFSIGSYSQISRVNHFLSDEYIDIDGMLLDESLVHSS